MLALLVFTAASLVLSTIPKTDRGLEGDKLVDSDGMDAFVLTVDSIFDVPWEQVGLAELRVFLADADDEGLLWEAKGPDPRKPDERFEARHVRESGCGFAKRRTRS